MMSRMRDPFVRVRVGLGILAAVILAGTVGHLLFGFSLLDSIYQTVSTITTVGFNSPHSLDAGSKAFTIVLILVGVGTALYTFSAVLEVLIEGHMRDLVRRRRMERDIDRMSGHVIICGWGRVGREVARFLENARCQVVVVDRDTDRLKEIPYASVHGDVTDDETLLSAGIERAATLVAALDADADNLTRPHVVDFVDIVMHDGTLEFRLEELSVSPTSPLSGKTLRSAQIRDRTGALVLAIRRPDGGFVTNPVPEDVIEAGDVLISVGTADQLGTLGRYATSP